MTRSNTNLIAVPAILGDSVWQERFALRDLSSSRDVRDTCLTQVVLSGTCMVLAPIVLTVANVVSEAGVFYTFHQQVIVDISLGVNHP